MPRLAPLPIEHAFGWSVNLEAGQEVQLFTDVMEPSIWWPPRAVLMRLDRGRASFDCPMDIGRIASSRPDIAVDIIVGDARYLIVSGPWLVAGAVPARMITVPVRQTVSAIVRPMAGAVGPAHVWMHCFFRPRGEP